MRTKLLRVLKKKAEAAIEEKKVTIELMLSKPAAIGEHTDVHYVGDMYKALQEYSDAKSILDDLNDFGNV